jgi:hypothetical protein
MGDSTLHAVLQIVREAEENLARAGELLAQAQMLLKGVTR